MINPYVLLAVALAWGASLGVAGWWSYGAGKNAEIARQESDEALMRQTREAAQQGAADAIATIKVQNVTRKVETLVRTDVVYRDCVHADGVLQLLEQVRTGVDPAAKGKLRDAAAAGRR